jgi:cytosine/adenosine deaminase-related metal-dependent hydrolase
LLLYNVKRINDSRPVNIAVQGEEITAIGTGNTDNDHFRIHFTNALALPGLINSHDHLDFNCFSPLGNEKYDSYTAWGKDIHKRYPEQIQAVLNIPQNLRATWGMYKNLLAGITTVINHGAYLKIDRPLINIHQETQNLHSVRFENKWKWKLNNPFKRNKICVIHAGEGAVEVSRQEIDELLKYNLLHRKIVAVHGVAMSAVQSARFMGLVWCPESNRILLNTHAEVGLLKLNTRIVFGTDSTLTGDWNLWEHLRFARTLKQLDDAELFGSATSVPADLWGLNNGDLQPGKDADLVIVKSENESVSWNDLYMTNPKDILMVLHKGKIRMFDKSLLSQLNSLQIDLYKYSQANVDGTTKFVEGDLPALATAIRGYNSHIRFPFN